MVQTLPEIFIILTNVRMPLARHREFSEDSCYGAHRLTSSAIDAFPGIDVVHIISLAGVDAVHGANLDTSAVFNPNARFSDNEGHVLP